MSEPYYNPYGGQTFFSFFGILLQRIFQFITGSLTVHDLASDEIQIIVLVGVAITAGLVGTFLVLRKMTMLANSISHTILLGIVLAYLATKSSSTGGSPINIQAMLVASLLMGVLTALLTEGLTKFANLQEDASTAIVFNTLFALGIVLVTLLTRNAHIGTEVVMGNVDSLRLEDCKLIFWVVLLNTSLFYLFFKEYKITTFDPGLAKALGISPLIFNYLLMVQASATIVGAFRAVGVLMVLSFITGPTLTARLLTHDLKKLLGLSILLGIIASLIGVGLARHLLTIYDMPLTTGGLVICVIFTIYLLTLSLSWLRQITPRFFQEVKN